MLKFFYVFCGGIPSLTRVSKNVTLPVVGETSQDSPLLLQFLSNLFLSLSVMKISFGTIRHVREYSNIVI